jgi:hypothetical protein
MDEIIDRNRTQTQEIIYRHLFHLEIMALFTPKEIGYFKNFAQNYGSGAIKQKFWAEVLRRSPAGLNGIKERCHRKAESAGEQMAGILAQLEIKHARSAGKMRQPDYEFAGHLNTVSLPLIRLLVELKFAGEILPGYFSEAELSSWESKLTRNQDVKTAELFLQELSNRSGMTLSDLTENATRSAETDAVSQMADAANQYLDVKNSGQENALISALDSQDIKVLIDLFKPT